MAIFEPALYWEYKEHPAAALEKVEAFLSTFSNELKALISAEKSLEENYELLSEKMGINAHPSLARKAKEASQFPSLKNNDYGEKYAIFLNHKIDCITLRLFGFLIANYKLHSLKISNNNLEREVDEVKRILDREGTPPHTQTSSPRSTSSGTPSSTVPAGRSCSWPA